jgi:hypothetical protein
MFAYCAGGQAQVFDIDAAPPPILLSRADYSTNLLMRLWLTLGLIESIIGMNKHEEEVKT